MALQTNVFEGGQWVTRTLEPMELFKGTTAAKSKTKPRPAEPPNYGILTRTIIDSPVIRWVLPVHLRSSRNHDVAFIGVGVVQTVTPHVAAAVTGVLFAGNRHTGTLGILSLARGGGSCFPSAASFCPVFGDVVFFFSHASTPQIYLDHANRT